MIKRPTNICFANCILLEHTLARMNRFQVLARDFRHSRQGHGCLLRVITGLSIGQLKSIAQNFCRSCMAF